ncbi:hypothetical protein [Lactobacillus delbrueckii]|uniref:hypothetical protein n=1 Tax=Lactobacillus delbrueckii TaxID=1584 RepID=UPI0020BD5961|nr:hypothetical protein [Lactobacillus delbrueckii]
MTEPVLADIPHIESWLLETDGEDIVGKSRQKHLEEVEVGQLLSLQLNPPYEQITVCPLEGDELGKLNHPLQGQNLVYRPEKPRKLKTRQPLKQATAPVAFSSNPETDEVFPLKEGFACFLLQLFLQITKIPIDDS